METLSKVLRPTPFSILEPPWVIVPVARLDNVPFAISFTSLSELSTKLFATAEPIFAAIRTPVLAPLVINPSPAAIPIVENLIRWSLPMIFKWQFHRS